MQYFKHVIVPLVALVLVCGVVSSAGSVEAKSKTFKLKVNLEHATSLSGKIDLLLYTNKIHASKTVNVGKLAQQLDHSQIFGKISFDVKESWFSKTLEGGNFYTICAHSNQLEAQTCKTQENNHKKTQTILVKVPDKGDDDDVPDF